MPEKLHRNIKAIYGLAFFHSFLIIVPVIVPFFMSKGLSLADIFYLQAIYAFTIVLLEAPSGYFADVFGRRFALLIGSLMHGAGYLLLNFSTDSATRGGLVRRFRKPLDKIPSPLGVVTHLTPSPMSDRPFFMRDSFMRDSLPPKTLSRHASLALIAVHSFGAIDPPRGHARLVLSQAPC